MSRFPLDMVHVQAHCAFLTLLVMYQGTSDDSSSLARRPGTCHSDVIYDNITVFHSSRCLYCACTHHATPTLVGGLCWHIPGRGLLKPTW